MKHNVTGNFSLRDSEHFTQLTRAISRLALLMKAPRSEKYFCRIDGSAQACRADGRNGTHRIRDGHSRVENEIIAAMVDSNLSHCPISYL
jgi:hypothetical protein